MMTILERTEQLRQKAKQFGRYRFVSDQSGVGYEWLTKFASGKIENPRVDNIAALEKFFKEHSSSDKAA
jgi:hypothetical protein